MNENNKIKVKRFLNKKVILGLLAFLCVVAFIIVSSFFPFIIDPSRWQTWEFVSDELIVCAITIFGIIAFTFIAQASNAQDPRSELARAKVDFYASVAKVNHASFRQWVKKVLQPRDIKEAKERKLASIGVEDNHILELSEAEIKGLIEPQKYGDRFYKALTKEQIKQVIKIKRSSGIKNLVDPTYYLTTGKVHEKGNISEQSGNEDKKKALLLTWSVGSKLIVSIMLAMIFASFVMEAIGEEELASAFMKLIQRLFTLANSSFFGYLIGCQTNDIDAYYIRLRIEAHIEFLEDKTFKPVNQQEEAKQEFINRVKKENTTALLEYNDKEGNA